MFKIKLLGTCKLPSSKSSNFGQGEFSRGAAGGTFPTQSAISLVPSSRHPVLKLFKETETDFVADKSKINNK